MRGGERVRISNPYSVAAIMATCAKAELRKTVFLATVLRFPDVATSTRLHTMHRLSRDLAQDNQS